MKCPACGKRIYVIQRGLEEYICVNEECPAKTGSVNPEWYGTQEQINKMYRGSEQKSS